MSTEWPKVKLEEMLIPIRRGETPIAGKIYRQIGVKLWGEGCYERERIDGADTKYGWLFRAEAGDVVVNKIWARNGSIAVVTKSLAGCFGSGEFPMFAPDPHRIEPRWIHWLAKTPWFWTRCDEKSRGTSGKNRIRPELFLQIEIPLPPLAEQQRVLAKIDQLAAKIAEVQELKLRTQTGVRNLLSGLFAGLIEGAPVFPMGEIAPLVRRPIEIDPMAEYPELGIRSFGRGTFHKAAVTGMEVGTKRLYQIHPGDLVLNNVFAWEGAVAVAKPEDIGRFGSHRFITCVPKAGLATANFLSFFFLTPGGLEKIGEASPGGAGRNRTLGLEALANIKVPIPAIEKQLWFDSLAAEVELLKGQHAETTAELEGLITSILNKAFSGEL